MAKLVKFIYLQTDDSSLCQTVGAASLPNPSQNLNTYDFPQLWKTDKPEKRGGWIGSKFHSLP
ncbi:MAG TPA: hypothetical protein DC064_05185 [Cyanobacteria bacterium UBA9273]|nr:hypothetical protein [Cyanobacteria bacterium UBA9273]